MSMLIALALQSALAGPPQLSCTPIEVTIPGEDKLVARDRPKGFRWEGFATEGVLEDGRMVLTRHATLEKLSQKDLRRQTEDGEIPDRVTQVILLDADGKLQGKPTTIPRGTMLEFLSLVDGGVAVARTFRAITVVDYIDDSGEYAGTVAMPPNPQADKNWRDNNPLRGTGPHRLTAVGPHRVVSWHAGEALAMDLSAQTKTSAESLYPLGIFTLRGRRDKASELFLVDRNRAMIWMDADLNRLRTKPCEACRVVGHDKPVPLDKAEGSWLPAMRQRGAAVGEAVDGGIRVSFVGLSSREREPDPVLLPVDIEGAWTWRLREGPWGTALISTSPRGAGTHLVRAIQPDEAEPVWTWTAPEGMLREGEDVVADALGPYVRVRITQGQGLDEKTRLALLVDPRDGRASEPVNPSSLQEPLREALSSPWVSRHYAGDVLLREVADPFMTRHEPGDSTARFERCRIRLP